MAGAPGGTYSWNGWDWNTGLFADPQRFVDWAHGQGLSLAINIHPSIDSNDPHYPATVEQGGPLTPDDGCRVLQADPTGTCMTFDWHDPRQLQAYLALHRPIYRKTAAYGHFGREDAGFTWERTDKAQALRAAAGLAPVEAVA